MANGKINPHALTALLLSAVVIALLIVLVGLVFSLFIPMAKQKTCECNCNINIPIYDKFIIESDYDNELPASAYTWPRGEQQTSSTSRGRTTLIPITPTPEPPSTRLPPPESPQTSNTLPSP